MTDKCSARNPSTCPHHGVVIRMRAAEVAGDLDGYMKLRDEVEEREREGWVEGEIVSASHVVDPVTGLSSKEFKLLWKRLRGAYLLSELKTMKVDYRSVAQVSFARNGEASFDYSSAGCERVFSKNACGFLAYALHEKTGLPFVVFTADPAVPYWEGHVAVKVGEDQFLDVTGVSSSGEYGSRYGFREGVFSMEEVTDVSRFRVLMDVPDGADVYRDLGDWEKAILDRCSSDIIRDFLG